MGRISVEDWNDIQRWAKDGDTRSVIIRVSDCEFGPLKPSSMLRALELMDMEPYKPVFDPADSVQC